MADLEGTGLSHEETELGEHTEDVIAWLVANANRTTGPGLDRSRPRVLEVNQIWGDSLLDTRHFTRRSLGRDVTIGSSVGYRWRLLGIDMGWVPPALRLVLPYTPPLWSEVDQDFKNDFFAPEEALFEADQVLFEHDVRAEAYTAVIDPRWPGFLDTSEQRYAFDQLVAAGLATQAGDLLELPMREGHRLMADVGGLVFFAHMVDPGRRVLAAHTNPDVPTMAIGSFMAFVGLMFGLMMYFAPDPPEITVDQLDAHLGELVMVAPEEPPEKKIPDANDDAGEGAKAKGEEGRTGKKHGDLEKARGNKIEVARQQLDRQIAENAGPLGAISRMDDLFGSSALDTALMGGVGDLVGVKGAQIGSGGLGSRGGSLGGGGQAEGLGGLGTKGPGSGRGGYGAGGGDLGRKSSGTIGAVGGQPIILGSLDRSLIDEVIKRHMNQIRYCYQRELTRNPALTGKVTTKFVISGDGSVARASTKSSTLNHAGVESCLNKQFLRMGFPPPKGNGIVLVSYPVIFSPG